MFDLILLLVRWLFAPFLALLDVESTGYGLCMRALTYLNHSASYLSHFFGSMWERSERARPDRHAQKAPVGLKTTKNAFLASKESFPRAHRSTNSVSLLLCVLLFFSPAPCCHAGKNGAVTRGNKDKELSDSNFAQVAIDQLEAEVKRQELEEKELEELLQKSQEKTKARKKELESLQEQLGNNAEVYYETGNGTNLLDSFTAIHQTDPNAASSSRSQAVNVAEELVFASRAERAGILPEDTTAAAAAKKAPPSLEENFWQVLQRIASAATTSKGGGVAPTPAAAGRTPVGDAQTLLKTIGGVPAEKYDGSRAKSDDWKFKVNLALGKSGLHIFQPHFECATLTSDEASAILFLLSSTVTPTLAEIVSGTYELLLHSGERPDAVIRRVVSLLQGGRVENTAVEIETLFGDLRELTSARGANPQFYFTKMSVITMKLEALGARVDNGQLREYITNTFRDEYDVEFAAMRALPPQEIEALKATLMKAWSDRENHPSRRRAPRRAFYAEDEDTETPPQSVMTPLLAALAALTASMGEMKAQANQAEVTKNKFFLRKNKENTKNHKTKCPECGQPHKGEQCWQCHPEDAPKWYLERMSAAKQQQAAKAAAAAANKAVKWNTDYPKDEAGCCAECAVPPGVPHQSFCKYK